MKISNFVPKSQGLQDFCVGSYFAGLIFMIVATLFFNWLLILDIGLYLLLLWWAGKVRHKTCLGVMVLYLIMFILHVIAGGIYMIIDPFALMGIATMVTYNKVPKFMKWLVE